MQINGTYGRGLATLALILTLTACNDLAGPGTGSGETIPAGMGLARIRLAAGGIAPSVRTAVPGIGGYYFALKFTAPGKTDVDETLDGSVLPALTLTVALEPAVWSLTVKGYTDAAAYGANDPPKVTGNISVPITGGTDANFDVYLSPDFGSGGTGTLSYSIALSIETSRAFLGLYPIDQTPATSEEIDISTYAGGTAIGNRTLPEGSYMAVIDLYDRANNKAVTRTEAAHIYNGLSTDLTRSFTAANFADCPPEVGNGLTTLAAKLEAALNSPSGSYTVVLDGGEDDLASFEPKTLNVTGNKNIAITIRGNGEEVDVDRIGTPLFTLGAAADSTLSLTLQDITLRGRSSNSVSVVQVNAGTLLMKAGSLITGNTNTSSFSPGGVYVSSYGTFSMSGGAISGNTSSTGGGVYVSYGIFNMSGGAVSGNTSSTGGGGGVYVSSSGTFSMSGGAVSGNTSSFGGGVYAYSAFNMSGGVVSGNILSNTNSYGKEVLVRSGTFRISGDARPERVFLDDNTRFITIGGPLSGGLVPIDLGITDSAPTAWETAPVLKLDPSYIEGDLASLKTHFTLGNSKRTDSSSIETAIPATDYEINDEGLFVHK
jgi:hypothetical protein